MAAISRRQILIRFMIPSMIAVTGSGCGTLLYPERRGQPRGGKVDWTVVGMDSIGLFFFFIPGVIAFAIDYGNGSLFLPPEHTSFDGQPIPEASYRQVSLGEGRPTEEAIEAALLQERQVQIRLSEVKVIRRPLPSLTEFPAIARECALHS